MHMKARAQNKQHRCATWLASHAAGVFQCIQTVCFLILLNGDVFLKQQILFNKHTMLINFHKYVSIRMYFWEHEICTFYQYIFFQIVWVFFSYLAFLSQTYTNHRFHLLHRHLDISRAITAESSPLHIASMCENVFPLRYIAQTEYRIGQINFYVLDYQGTQFYLYKRARKKRT